uniref:SRCR domain-containing protein n=1 Tax=Haplochromis burtoni TaxID=8153 RepID=A0A3Q2V2L6_HAPBU
MWMFCSPHKLCHNTNLGAEYLIRLAGSGSSRCSGRVEIFHSNVWGTVSDYNWDLNDAEVVCRQLNCGTALEATPSSKFGAGTGQVCLHSYDVGCYASVFSLRYVLEYSLCYVFYIKGVIRLNGSGSTRCSGRVEVYYNNSWGTVCDGGWDLNDAEVVCRQLDCGSALEVPQSAHFGAGTGQIWLGDVTCSGSESSLTECQHSGFGSNRCEHGQDAAVICSDLIRLAGFGSSRCSGRVEIFHNNIWGTVSDYNWDLNDAEVVCRQINCGSALQAPRSAYFGAGTGQIWLSGVSCSGNESSLTECPNFGWGNYYNGHYSDAGVICSAQIILCAMYVGRLLLLTKAVTLFSSSSTPLASLLSLLYPCLVLCFLYYFSLEHSLTVCSLKPKRGIMDLINWSLNAIDILFSTRSLCLGEPEC